jgi:hypothetical protein
MKLASDGKTQFLCGLCLGAVHRDEAVDFRGGMKPQSRPQVSEIERPRRNEVGIQRPVSRQPDQIPSGLERTV